MNDIVDLNTDNAVEVPAVEVVVAPTDRLANATKTVTRSMAKLFALDEQLATQQGIVTTAKDAVTEALTNGKGFDEAGRAFKAANNKLDKLLESRELLTLALQEDLDEVRFATDSVAALLRSLEA